VEVRSRVPRPLKRKNRSRYQLAELEIAHQRRMQRLHRAYWLTLLRIREYGQSVQAQASDAKPLSAAEQSEPYGP
jgi:hypothetical protein